MPYSYDPAASNTSPLKVPECGLLVTAPQPKKKEPSKVLVIYQLGVDMLI